MTLWTFFMLLLLGIGAIGLIVSLATGGRRGRLPLLVGAWALVPWSLSSVGLFDQGAFGLEAVNQRAIGPSTTKHPPACPPAGVISPAQWSALLAQNAGEHQSRRSSQGPWVPTAVLENKQRMYANHHPSEASAVASLLAHLSMHYASAEWVLDASRQVVVGASQEDWLSGLVKQLKALGVAQGRITAGPTETSGRTVTVSLLRHQPEGLPGSSGLPVSPASVRLMVSVDGLPQLLEASYQNESWVHGLAHERGLADDLGPAHEQGLEPGAEILAGYSALVDSPEAARREALEHLAAVIQEAVVQEGAIQNGAIQDGAIQDADAPDALVKVRNGEVQVIRLENGGERIHAYTVDRAFLQSFERPYGTLWRQAVMVNGGPAAERSRAGVGPDLLDQAAGLLADQAGRGATAIEIAGAGARTGTAAAASERDRPSRGVGQKVVAVAGLVGVVTAMYWLLNVITRGYFRGRGLLALGGLLLAGAVWLAMV